MLRKLGFLTALIVLAAWMGCRSCGAPYDHCQPTFVPEHGDQCMGELYRAGSVMGGMKRTAPADSGCKSCQANASQAGAGQAMASQAMAPEFEQVMNEQVVNEQIVNESMITPGLENAQIIPQGQIHQQGAYPVSSEVELAPYSNNADPMIAPSNEPLLKEGEFILSE